MTAEGVRQKPAGRLAADERLAGPARECAEAFRRYLANPDESALLGAYELGRKAMAEGLGVLEMTRVVASAVAAVTAPPDGDNREALAGAAETFLVEALSPFEMAHRGYREANAVLRRLNEMLEAQARRIASSLHDEASELLTPLHLALAEAAAKAPSSLTGDLTGIRTLLNGLEERLRVLAHELRPPALDRFGLVPALELLAESTALRHGVVVRLQAPSGISLAPSVEATLYRVVQEALHNVVKHAHASCADVSIVRRPRKVVCAVSDDGIGLAQASTGPAGIGLSGMRERVAALGGAVRIDPAPGGAGTVLAVEIPLEA